jgi:hypothetical protein
MIKLKNVSHNFTSLGNHEEGFMNNTHEGSCLCGQVKYEVEGNFESFFFCHCKHCQKDTGSAHAANLFSSNAKLKWVTKTDNIKTFNLPATKHIRSFCGQCGSAVPSLQMEGKLLVVPAGSLDTIIEISPTAHIFCESRAPWEDKLGNIKKFEKYPF